MQRTFSIGIALCLAVAALLYLLNTYMTFQDTARMLSVLEQRRDALVHQEFHP